MTDLRTKVKVIDTSKSKEKQIVIMFKAVETEMYNILNAKYKSVAKL
jgi:hypothetical protein